LHCNHVPARHRDRFEQVSICSVTAPGQAGCIFLPITFTRLATVVALRFALALLKPLEFLSHKLQLALVVPAVIRDYEDHPEKEADPDYDNEKRTPHPLARLRRALHYDDAHRLPDQQRVGARGGNSW